VKKGVTKEGVGTVLNWLTGQSHRFLQEQTNYKANFATFFPVWGWNKEQIEIDSSRPTP
jgi:hypothetical protein